MLPAAKKKAARKTANEGANAPSASRLYAGRVNAQWARLMGALGMDVSYARASGTHLWTEDGERFTDFLSGYCVQNIGHAHPTLVAALQEELGRAGPLILQSYVPHLAAELAERLCALAGSPLDRVCFTNTGSESVETAMKFSRLHARRPGILYSEGAFHGISYGAMSLMQQTRWADGFGPFLPETQGIPFLDLELLETHLRTGRYAAFVSEPIQSEAGVKMVEPEVLQEAQRLCRQHGTLFVMDEVQTGLFRTGPFLASHHFGLEPDMVLLAKALGGGAMPVGAVLMTADVNASVFRKIDRAFVSASTFSENTLAMRAALTTLDVLEGLGVEEHVTGIGAGLRAAIDGLAGDHELLQGARGLGLMNGVVLQAPRSLKLRAIHGAFRTLHEGLFGQMVVRRMFRPGHVLTQVCGNDHMVLKACPPLVADTEDVEAFRDALDSTLSAFESGEGFLEGLEIGRRTLGRA